ncbi:hypothetical protein QQF64_016416 [Cirrhinus molitorella]|uniref:Uncharacterized protein n=1 Tax=Cirrhinus molitorella TaxID=172907 RepID=A0ABR3LRE9_9TELE
MYCGGPWGPEPKAGVSVSQGLVLMSKPAGFGRAADEIEMCVDCRNSTRGHRVTGKADQVRDDLHPMQFDKEIIKMTNTLSVFDVRKIVKTSSRLVLNNPFYTLKEDGSLKILLM